MKKVLVLSFIAIIFITGCNERKQESLRIKLIESVEKNDSSSVKKILKKGINPNQIITKDGNEYSLLYFSTFHDFTDISVSLIDYGASVNWINSKDRTDILNNAIWNENEVVLNKLLEKGVSLNHRYYKEQDFWEEIITDRKYEAALFLIQNASVRKKIVSNSDYWYTYIPKLNSEIELLISKAYDGKIELPSDVPLISLAIFSNNLDAVKFLYKNGLNFSQEYYLEDDNEQLMTPLDMAFSNFEIFTSRSKIDREDFGYSEDSPEGERAKKIIEFIKLVVE